MSGSTEQSRDAKARERDAGIWSLVDRQHGVVTRRQLLERGLNARQIEQRIAKGRLHPIWRGVYAVGRPQLSQYGRWTAAVLVAGPGAVLSHASAGALWGFGAGPASGGAVEVSLPAGRSCRHPGIRAHRRAGLAARDLGEHERIPVTSPVRTLIDLAPRLEPRRLERYVNEADKLERVAADVLYASLDEYRGAPGVVPLRTLLDPLHFRLSDSDLEQAMRPVVAAAGLPVPETKAWVNRFEVDFYWPDLGIVVEADGLRYHRTPSQQRRALQRDQTHLASGLWPLRFSHWQIAREPAYVRKILRRTAERARQTQQAVDFATR